MSSVVPYPGGNGSFPPSYPLRLGDLGAAGVGERLGGGGGERDSGDDSEAQRPVRALELRFHGRRRSAGSTHADDSAYLLGASYGLPLPAQWTLAANGYYQYVGTYFTSLANQTLPPDRRAVTASATLSGHGVALSGSDGFTEDNTDDNASLPTVRSLPRTLNLSYSPPVPASVTAWLGTPSASLCWQDARTHNTTLPAGAQATDSDVVNDTATLNFAYPHFSWQIGVTGGEFRDYTGQQDNTDTFGPTGGINVTFAGSGFVGFNLQLLDSHDLQQDTHTLDRNYALTGGDTFWANRMTAQLSLSINHNTQQVIPGTLPPQLVGNDVVLKTATAQLTWHAIPATRTRGGLDLGLSSAWNESSGLNSSVLTSQGFSALATRGTADLPHREHQMAARARRSLNVRVLMAALLRSSLAALASAPAAAQSGAFATPGTLSVSLQSTLPTTLVWTVRLTGPPSVTGVFVLPTTAHLGAGPRQHTGRAGSADRSAAADRALAGISPNTVQGNIPETFRLTPAAVAEAQRLGVNTLVLTRTFGLKPAVTARVTIEIGGSGSGPLALSRVALHFDDRTLVRVLRQGESAVAIAEITFSGNGVFSGLWEVASPPSTQGEPVFVPLGAASTNLTAGGIAEVTSPALPSSFAGTYYVRFRVRSPVVPFQSLVLRYASGTGTCRCLRSS